MELGKKINGINEKGGGYRGDDSKQFYIDFQFCRYSLVLMHVCLSGLVLLF